MMKTSDPHQFSVKILSISVVIISLDYSLSSYASQLFGIIMKKRFFPDCKKIESTIRSVPAWKKPIIPAICMKGGVGVFPNGQKIRSDPFQSDHKNFRMVLCCKERTQAFIMISSSALQIVLNRTLPPGESYLYEMHSLKSDHLLTSKHPLE